MSHSIDRRIIISRNFNSQPDTIIGDPSQLQNTFLNLGVNARDAMPDGGKLTFSTKNVSLNKEECFLLANNIQEGDFIKITITDTGCGMSSELQEHIFEPFYTTKKPGEGTGLGLAAVYGCVGSHGGDIKVFSQVGKGSTFSILLPCQQAKPESQSIALFRL